MYFNIRKATISDLPQIWTILQQAIMRRKNEGGNQWQDGYPNPDVIKKDISKEVGYILTDREATVGYCAIFINDESE